MRPPRLPLAPAALLLASMACGASTGGAPTGPPPADTRPRAILLITVDGLTGSDLAAMPRIASLASEGRSWTQAWTSSPETRPAVAGLLTGVAPDRSGVIDDLTMPLRDDVPTLAAALAKAGFSTAAFPGSAALGTPSGLLRGFQIVDEPPPLPFGPAARLPAAVDGASKAGNFATWLRSVPAASPWFGWIHLSDPWRAVVGGAADGRASAVAKVDAAVGSVLDAVRAHGDTDRALVVVAGTFADVRGGETEPPGPGFSLAERAIRVPLIVRAPQGTTLAAAADAPVSTLDAAVTMAAAAGVSLTGAEGLDLRSAPPADRTLYAFAWATWAQAGWPPLRAARRGAGKWVEGSPWGGYTLAGSDERRGEGSDPVISAARAAVDARPVALRATIPFDQARRALEREHVAGNAAPETGRLFAAEAQRRGSAAKLWEGRAALARGAADEALAAYASSLEADNAGLGAMVERGIVLYRKSSPEARAVLTRAAATYPWSPDAVHWFGHAIESDRARAEPLWKLVYTARPHDPDVAYDLACTRSVAGDVDGSLAYLERAIAAGYTRWESMQADPDLRTLRASPKFLALMRAHGR